MTNKSFESMVAKDGPLKGTHILYAPIATSISVVNGNKHPFWFGFFFVFGVFAAFSVIFGVIKFIDLFFPWLKI